jgi:hypothetical protein
MGMLVERAESIGVSTGELAKQIVISALQDKWSLESLRLLQEVQEDVGQLRADLALTLETVLLNLSKAASKEEVKEFVAKRLRRRP